MIIIMTRGRFARDILPLFIPSHSHNILWLFNCCWPGTRRKIMDVSRETADVTTKPTCYDLSNILVQIDQWYPVCAFLLKSITFPIQCKSIVSWHVLIWHVPRIPFGWSSVKLGTIQRRLARPLRKDDTHTSRSVSNIDMACTMTSSIALVPFPRPSTLSHSVSASQQVSLSFSPVTFLSP